MTRKLVTVFPLMCAQGVVAAEWEWTVAPYLWVADVNLDLGVAGDPGLGGGAEVPLPSIVDKIDAAFMGHLEVRQGKWGGFLDLIWLKLSDQATIPVGPGGPILGDLNVSTDTELRLSEVGGLYRMGGSPANPLLFDLLIGVRFVDVDSRASVTLPGPGAGQVDIATSPSETDVLIGGRLSGEFASRWHWALRGDFSFGGTEGTVNALAAAGYAFGESGLFSLDLGYRYMSIEVDGNSRNGSSTELDLTLSGPVLGFVFKF